jgi:hypothetical protein
MTFEAFLLLGFFGSEDESVLSLAFFVLAGCGLFSFLCEQLLFEH